MDNKAKPKVPKVDEEPQIFKPEKVEGRWRFSRGDFLKLAVTTTVSVMAAFVPGVKDLLGRRIQLVAHATQLDQPSLLPGQQLVKIWYLKNNSDQPWGEGAVLSLIGAKVWQVVHSIPLPNLLPGQVTSLRVPMVMPTNPDPRPVKASIEITDELFDIFLPIIHKPPTETPCACDSDLPCTCDAVFPCTCHTDIPCTCDYEIPCVCDTYFCACDYEVPCVCDTYYCACDYLPPCTCDNYVPCSCVYYVPCGCVGYVPCGCDYYF